LIIIGVGSNAAIGVGYRGEPSGCIVGIKDIATDIVGGLSDPALGIMGKVINRPLDDVIFVN
jgi:hypothetical protein